MASTNEMKRLLRMVEPDSTIPGFTPPRPIRYDSSGNRIVVDRTTDGVLYHADDDEKSIKDNSPYGQ